MSKKCEIKDSKSFVQQKQVNEEKLPSLNRPVYSFVVLDAHGPYCWSMMTGDCLIEVLKKLKTFETLTWQELGNNGSHNVETYRLSDTASKRLRELELDDLDEIYSLRLSGLERVWGIKERDWFKILWWDPNHQVCPARLKHLA